MRGAVLALAAVAALGPGLARADLECEYMSFQLSDVDNDHSVSICECGRFLASGDTIHLIAQRLSCTADGWQITTDLCLDESYTDPDPTARRAAAADALRAYNDSFLYCR